MITLELKNNYELTKDTVSFDGRTFTHEKFLELAKEIDFETRKETTKVTFKGRSTIIIAEDNIRLTTADIAFIEELITLGYVNNLIDSGIEEIVPTYFNKYFNYFLFEDRVFILDSIGERYGSWEKQLIVDTGIPTIPYNHQESTNLINISNGNIPRLTGRYVGMGFTLTEYERFINLLR